MPEQNDGNIAKTPSSQTTPLTPDQTPTLKVSDGAETKAVEPKPWESERKPNVQFVGRKQIHTEKGMEIVAMEDVDIPRFITTGLDTIQLPPADLQRKGFFHPNAGFLRRNYGSIYKKPVVKGNDNSEVNDGQ